MKRLLTIAALLLSVSASAQQMYKTVLEIKITNDTGLILAMGESRSMENQWVNAPICAEWIQFQPGPILYIETDGTHSLNNYSELNWEGGWTVARNYYGPFNYPQIREVWVTNIFADTSRVFYSSIADYIPVQFKHKVPVKMMDGRYHVDFRIHWNVADEPILFGLAAD